MSDFSVLLARVSKYTQTEEIERLRVAYEFAEKSHEGQFRVSGEPYITHPLEITLLLAGLEMDIPTLLAALLHDVVEDTSVTIEQVRDMFGEDVAELVDGVTKLSKIKYKTKEEQQAENMRKMFLAMGKDVRVILIKLADRLHNMRTLGSMPEQKQIDISNETLEIFAPIANRLGIYQVKWELEDLALRYLDPEMYYFISEKIDKKRDEREEYIQGAINQVKEKLEISGVIGKIEGRPKHFYGIYEKIKKKNKEFSEIYDLIGIRVQVDTVKDCYAALGLVHDIWRPLPGRFKDYIAMPKPNLYQSLHTTVIGPQGEPLEIQIRTYEMHTIAERGIAAHWKYKEGGRVDGDVERKMRWLREMADLDNEASDAKEFMEKVKMDFFSDEVFVFTPGGDIVDLPKGSTPLDFAYRIHTDIGHRCIGAKVNGKIVPLDYHLNNGDIVEVLTSKIANGPSRDWLKIVKTAQARNKIRQWFKRFSRDENIARGKELLDKELKKNNIDPNISQRTQIINSIVTKMKVGNVDELYAGLGHGGITPHQMVNRWLEELKKVVPQELDLAQINSRGKKGERVKAYNGVIVAGVGDVMVRFANCCSPLPGDEIVGYITKGRGVSIHRKDCVNVISDNESKENRLIDVCWANPDDAVYKVRIDIDAADRAGVLADIISVISESKINISNIEARPLKNRMSLINLVVEVQDSSQADRLQAKLKKIKYIEDVRRAMQSKD